MSAGDAHDRGKRCDLIASYFTFAGNALPSSGRPSPIDFRHRVEIAGAAGYVGFGLFHTDLHHVVAEYGFADMRAIFADNGVGIVELEVLKDWFTDGERRRTADKARRFLLDAAARLGAHHVKVTGDFAADWPLEVMIESFGMLCDEAAEAGTRVAIEFLPFSHIPDVHRAMEIVTGADRPNGGLLVDIWHVRRAGTPDEDIARLPANRIIGVELSDGAAHPVGSLYDDSIQYRRFCGDGAFNVPSFLAAIRETGYAGAFGVELLSDEIRAMDLPTVAARVWETTRSQFRQA